MQVKSFYRYDLIKADVPDILRKAIVKDAKVGGIKLQYEVSTVKALVFQFLNKQRIISITIPKDKETRTFLRPYKELWDSTGRNRLPKCLWGKNDDVLTNHWVELELDYKDLNSGAVIPKMEIRDTNITKHLTKHKKQFFVYKK